MTQIFMPIPGIIDGGGAAPGARAPGNGVADAFGEILAGLGAEWQGDGEALPNPDPDFDPEPWPEAAFSPADGPDRQDELFVEHPERPPEPPQPTPLLAGLQAPFDAPIPPTGLFAGAVVEDGPLPVSPERGLAADGRAVLPTMKPGSDAEAQPRADRPAEPAIPIQRPPVPEAERPPRPPARSDAPMELVPPRAFPGERAGVMTADAGARPASGLAQALVPGLGEPGQSPQSPPLELIASQFQQLQELGAKVDGRPNLAIAVAVPQADLALPLSDSPAIRAAVPAIAVEIAARARDGARQFTIQLDPPELGRIDVRLDIARDGAMTAKLVIDRPETLDLLVRDARVLEKTLQASGLKLEEGGLHYQLRDQSGFAGHERSGAGADGRAGGGEMEDEHGHGSAAGDDDRGARRMSLGGVDIRV